MDIPDYQRLMLPLLKFAKEAGRVLTTREAILHVISVFNLSDDQQRALLPSGRQPIIDNRVGWAKQYLTKAELLKSISSPRGAFEITDEGVRVIDSNPVEINVRFLKRYPQFVEFVRGTGDRKDSPQADEQDDVIPATPEEQFLSGYKGINARLAEDLLNQVVQLTPIQFQRLVVDLLVKIYGSSSEKARKSIKLGADGGIDGEIERDRLGLDKIYIQAKKWEGQVSSSEVQKFVGSLQQKNVGNRGVFVTTSTFSKPALEYIRSIPHNVKLIDGEALTELMIDHDIGVSPSEKYEIKKIDSGYFEDL